MEEFDFDASTDQAWSLFGERLAEVVSLVEEGDPLTVATLAGSERAVPAIRFSALPRAERSRTPQVLAEVLDPGAGGRTDQLRDLGWRAPDAEHARPWVRHVQDDCRWITNQATTVLREVLGVQHPLFLAPDQLADLLQPATPEGEEDAVPGVLQPHDALATMPTSQDHLDRLIDTELRHLYGYPALRDESGDFAIRVGSSMVFVRSTPDLREVVVFSALVHDVEGRSRATEVLNDLNTESRFGRFSIHRDRVYVSLGLLARPFVPAHLHEGVQIISQIADGIDDELAAKLHGRVTFRDTDHPGH